MAKKTPTIRNKILTLWDYDLDNLIMEFDISLSSEWAYWQEFLNSETTKSFRFIGPDGTSCSVVKEKRRGRGKRFWYAHKRLDGKLRRKYLGLSENLTYRKLEAVAFKLSQRELI